MYFSKLAERLTSFVAIFQSCFKTITKNSDLKMDDVLTSFIVSKKSDCQELSSFLNVGNYQCLHHFISNGKWDFKLVLNKMVDYFLNLLPVDWLEDLSLSIDESGFEKSGNHSCGVASQYCGQVGKITNYQIGAFALFAY